MATKPYHSPQPPIGLTIQWFPHADPQERPYAAIVNRVPSNDTVGLAILPPSGPAITRTGVRFIGDPYFKTCERQMKNSRGAWGFVPGLEVKESPSLEESHRTIRQAYTEKKSPAEIAKLVGAPWTDKTVLGYLRRQGLINA